MPTMRGGRLGRIVRNQEVRSSSVHNLSCRILVTSRHGNGVKPSYVGCLGQGLFYSRNVSSHQAV